MFRDLSLSGVIFEAVFPLSLKLPATSDRVQDTKSEEVDY